MSNMDFVNAVGHAFLGYRIRRAPWGQAEVSLRTCCLFLNCDRKLQWVFGNAAHGEEVGLCPIKPDLGVDLLPEDIAATDWEIVR